MASDQSSERPGRGRVRQRTISTARPTSIRVPTARDTPYSLAGTRETRSRPPARHETYVDEGYRALNPEYEREVQDPVFSLGGNLPHTVRGFMKHQGKNGKSQPVGYEKEEKGARETAPQLQNTDDQADRTSRQAKHSENETEGTPADEMPGTPGSHVGTRTLEARDSNGQNLGTIGEEAVPYPDRSDDERTLAGEESVEATQPFNPWAGIRKKYQHFLGEWLGVSHLSRFPFCNPS